jgi:thiol-disulfide isomerase/thioredoxin
VLLALCAAVMLSSATNAAELVMFRRDGCPWCLKFDREIGPIYPKTEFNQRAPLRHVNLDHDRDVGLVHGPIRYTPTFVLAEDGKEVGRIEGYPGDEYFWPRLESLMERAPMPPAPKNAPVSSATPIALKVGR